MRESERAILTTHTITTTNHSPSTRARFPRCIRPERYASRAANVDDGRADHAVPGGATGKEIVIQGTVVDRVVEYLKGELGLPEKLISVAASAASGRKK